MKKFGLHQLADLHHREGGKHCRTKGRYRADSFGIANGRAARKQGKAGPQDDQHPDHADQYCRPAEQMDAFLEQQGTERHDQQRRRITDGGGFRQGQAGQREKSQPHRCDTDKRPDHMSHGVAGGKSGVQLPSPGQIGHYGHYGEETAKKDQFTRRNGLRSLEQGGHDHKTAHRQYLERNATQRTFRTVRGHPDRRLWRKWHDWPVAVIACNSNTRRSTS